MDESSRVFLDMDPGKLDFSFLAVISFNLDIATLRKGLIVLRYLVCLVQVGIEVVFTGQIQILV